MTTQSHKNAKWSSTQYDHGRQFPGERLEGQVRCPPKLRSGGDINVCMLCPFVHTILWYNAVVVFYTKSDIAANTEVRPLSNWDGVGSWIFFGTVTRDTQTLRWVDATEHDFQWQTWHISWAGPTQNLGQSVKQRSDHLKEISKNWQ